MTLAAVVSSALAYPRALAAGCLAAVCTLVGFHLLAEWERGRRISALRRLRSN